MCEERATRAEIKWIETFSGLAQFKETSVKYVPLFMSLPLLECSDGFMRQIALLKPSVWDVFEQHVVEGAAAWAAPAARVFEIQMCAERAYADAQTVWLALKQKRDTCPRPGV